MNKFSKSTITIDFNLLQFYTIPASVCKVIFRSVIYTFSIFLSSYYDDTQFGESSHCLKFDKFRRTANQ